MKTVFLESHNIKNQFSGLGQFNYNLIKGFYKQNDPDLKMTLHAKNFSALKAEFGDFFKYRRYFSITRYPQFRISKKYDLWHSLNQNTKIEPKNKIPYILTVHDVHFALEGDDFSDERRQRFNYKLNQASAIVYISEFAKKSTHQKFNVPNVPEYVIYNGNTVNEAVLEEDFSPSILPKGPYLFSIGEFTPRKNFDALVRMLPYLPDYHLVLSGNETKGHLPIIEEEIKKNNIKDRVHITGKITEKEKQFYLKNCAAFVFPSLREGFGIPIIEALSFGKPVIASNNTAIPEVGGNLAHYWDNFESEYMATKVLQAIEEVQNDATFLKKAKAHCQKFDWNETAKQYLEVYKQVLNS